MLCLRQLTVFAAFPVAFGVHAQSGCDSVHTILGSYFQLSGAMFSVVATAPITIEHLSANLSPGTSHYSLHMRFGGYVGHTTDPAEWIALDTVPVPSANTTLQTSFTCVMPMALNAALDVGDTLSFFLVDHDASRLRSFGNFTPPGQVIVSDTNMGITVAYALPGNFGTPYGTKEWSGRVAYCLREEQAVEAIAAQPSLTVAVNGEAIRVDGLSPSTGGNDDRVELLDLGGRPVRSVAQHAGTAFIPIADLASGVYLVRVRGGAQRAVRVMVP